MPSLEDDLLPPENKIVDAMLFALIAFAMLGPFIVCLGFLVLDFLSSGWLLKNVGASLTEFLNPFTLFPLMHQDFVAKCGMPGALAIVLGEVTCWALVIFNVIMTVRTLLRGGLMLKVLSAMNSIISAESGKRTGLIVLLSIGTVMFGVLDAGLWKQACGTRVLDDGWGEIKAYLVPGIYMTMVCHIVGESLSTLITKAHARFKRDRGVP